MNFKKKCPVCGQLEDVRIIMELGKCIKCDQLEGDAFRESVEGGTVKDDLMKETGEGRPLPWEE